MTLQLSWRLLLPSGFQRGQVQTKVEALRLRCLELPMERIPPEAR